ncbi:MAG: hypothetical protein V4537_14360 [Pseudomonadota bacterium]
MAGYAKLFGSILQSSIWDLPPEECKVWVTLLALKDRDGLVSASLPGLAHEARLPRDVVQRALNIFLAPDPDSRSPENEGRRIEGVLGIGWRILNNSRYRDLESIDDRRKKGAERQQRHRDRQRQRREAAAGSTGDVTRAVTQSNASNGIRSDHIKTEGTVTATPEGETPEGDDASGGAKSPQTSAQEAGGASWRWDGHRWYTLFGAAWCVKTGRIAYGRGTDRDSIAKGELTEMLASLPDEEARAAQAAAPAMFALFLADKGQAAEAGYPWSWFVGRFNGLRGKVGTRAGGFGDFSASEYPDEDVG